MICGEQPRCTAAQMGGPWNRVSRRGSLAARGLSSSASRTASTSSSRRAVNNASSQPRAQHRGTLGTLKFGTFGRGVVGADELVPVTWSASVATTNSSSVSSSKRRGQHGIRGGVDAMKFSCPCGTGEGLRQMLSDRGEGSKGDSPRLDALVEHSDPR